MKYTFYEVLWKILQEEKKIDEWKALGLLVQKQHEYYWTPEALELAGVQSSLPLSEDIEWIPTFIELFSKKNIGITGKTSNEKVVADRMRRFIKEYGYDAETILGATVYYIREKLSQGNPQFIREAHYFIYKKTEKGVETSDLATWCKAFLDDSKKNTPENRTGGDI